MKPTWRPATGAAANSPSSTARRTTGAPGCCRPRSLRDVFTVYALCRLADDIVDEPEQVDLAVPQEGTPAERLQAFRATFFKALEAGSDEPVMAHDRRQHPAAWDGPGVLRAVLHRDGVRPGTGRGRPGRSCGTATWRGRRP